MLFESDPSKLPSKREIVIMGALALATIFALLGGRLAHGQTPSIKTFQQAAPTAATIVTTDKRSENFLIAFAPGAVEACTIFKSEADTIIERDNDGNEHTVPYMPRNCWFFSPETTGYNDVWGFVLPDGGTWTVYAEVYYDQPDGTIATVTTNSLKVKR